MALKRPAGIMKVHWMIKTITSWLSKILKSIDWRKTF